MSNFLYGDYRAVEFKWIEAFLTLKFVEDSVVLVVHLNILLLIEYS